MTTPAQDDPQHGAEGSLRSEIRWTIVVVVLAVVGIVALWPRGIDRGGPPAGGSSPQVLTDPADATSAAPDDIALAPLRQRAGLTPCPAVLPSAPTPSGPLAGISVPCLGSPGQVDLAARLAGRPALLNVWASWCQPCREEIPVLAAYAARPDAVPVIGINVLDRPEAALSLLADLNAHYPSVTDPDTTLRRALRWPRVLPTSYVLHPDGTATLIPPTVFRSPDEIDQAVRRYLIGNG